MNWRVGWVEDQEDKNIRFQIELERKGIHLVVFEDRYQAESFFARGGQVDAMIFDLLIPEGGPGPIEPQLVIGLELMKRVVGKHIPPERAFVLTVLQDPQLEEPIRQLGLQDDQVCTKDIDRVSFADLVLARVSSTPVP